MGAEEKSTWSYAGVMSLTRRRTPKKSLTSDKGEGASDVRVPEAEQPSRRVKVSSGLKQYDEEGKILRFWQSNRERGCWLMLDVAIAVMLSVLLLYPAWVCWNCSKESAGSFAVCIGRKVLVVMALVGCIGGIIPCGFAFCTGRGDMAAHAFCPLACTVCFLPFPFCSAGASASAEGQRAAVPLGIGTSEPDAWQV